MFNKNMIFTNKSKYGNIKAVIDGIEFDSTKEANRYFELKALEKIGEITDLQVQPRFEVAPGFRHEGRPWLPRVYVADFAYYNKDKTYVVEDVKSDITRKNPVYRLKIHLFLLQYKDKCLFREV